MINHQKGLTLVELLVAITLSVVLAGYSFKLFHSIVDSQKRITVSQDTLADLSLMVQFFEKDILQIQQDSTNRNGYDQIEPALLNSPESLITLTRLGWPLSPVQNLPRSELQRVNWYLVDQSEEICRHTVIEGMTIENTYCLVRSYNRQLDSIYNEDVVVVDLVGYVSEAKISFLVLDEKNNQEWREEWPLFDQPGSEVIAIELKIEHQRFGELKWMFQVPSKWSAS